MSTVKSFEELTIWQEARDLLVRFIFYLKDFQKKNYMV